MKRSKGFSLAEMMAVIAVLGILAVLLLPNVLNAYRDAKKGVLLDEAKSVYAEARNKYATEKASGKVVSVLTDAESTDENTYELDLSNNNIEYFVRLDAHGEVISLVVIDGDYCVAGTGDFLDTATKDQVVSLYDEEGNIRGECTKNNATGLYATVILDTEGGSTNLINNVSSSFNELAPGINHSQIIYYYFGQGWYKKNANNEMEPIANLNNLPTKNEKVYESFVDSHGNEVINSAGNLSNSQETIARYKVTSDPKNTYCADQEASKKDYSKCVITLTAKYRDPGASLVFQPCGEAVTGNQGSLPIYNDVEVDLPTGENVTFVNKGHQFVGWTEGSCENTTLIPDNKYKRTILNANNTENPEDTTPYDGVPIHLYAEWFPNTIEASDVICKPDADNYCTQPVYYNYYGLRFVLYRITSEGYKAILDGVQGPYSYLQTDCCNHGNCYYTSVNYTRSQLAKLLNGSWLSGKNANVLVNSSWYSGYKNNELLNIETARVGIMNYAEYLHTNGKNYMFVFNGAPNKWWWTMTPTTNQPYYYDGQYYLANVILRYNGGVVEYDEMTVNGTIVGTNHIYGNNNDVYYRPVVVFKPGTTIELDPNNTGTWGSKTNSFIIK